VLGTLVFISSEVVFFAALVVAFIEFRTRSVSGPGPGVLDVPPTALFSVALFASSGTLVLAERRLRRDDGRGFRLWLLVTILLGAIFIAGQGIEYARLASDHVTISRNLFTSAFYTLTGFHGFHVILGLIALSVLAGLAFAGDFAGGRRRSAMEAVSVYWHFVDAVWVVIFSVVYLWTLID
jgi:heme/copper-type cytochrome/quinol oxidase subunit 3